MKQKPQKTSSRTRERWGRHDNKKSLKNRNSSESKNTKRSDLKRNDDILSANGKIRVLDSTLTALSIAVLVVLSPWQFKWSQSTSSNVPLVVKSMTLAKSQAWALSETQMLVDEIWKEVHRQYYDRSFAGKGEEAWRKQRLEAIQKVNGLTLLDDTEKQQVYAIVRNMLNFLQDPYTRYLTPEQYETLVSYAKGTISSTTLGGVGVQLLADPATGEMVIMNTVSKGPADTAGIQPGDVLMAIDGQPIDKSTTAELVAAQCRGNPNTPVQITIRRAGMPPRSVTVTRAVLPNTSVEASTFTTENGQTVGLLKLTSFSQETTKQVMEALKQLKASSKRNAPTALVLDLRSNAGGYMPAGVNVAKLFLPPQASIVSEVDKNGKTTVYTNDGTMAGSSAETQLPLYVLVDARTASASEIMAAALQENHRAILVSSSSHTFGKGRIQNVQELSDGGGIAVTKAKYITPTGKDIQGIGITPDRIVPTCQISDSAANCLADVL
jgi:carboxyl-terminal processing protease